MRHAAMNLFDSERFGAAIIAVVAFVSFSQAGMDGWATFSLSLMVAGAYWFLFRDRR